MILKNITAGLAFVMLIVAGVLGNVPGCHAGSTRFSPVAAQDNDLMMSPFKGPPTARVVITVFSDFQ